MSLFVGFCNLFYLGCRRFTVGVSSKLEGTGVKFAELEQVVDDVISVLDVTAV
jgi:hypothetical protein